MRQGKGWKFSAPSWELQIDKISDKELGELYDTFVGYSDDMIVVRESLKKEIERREVKTNESHDN